MPNDAAKELFSHKKPYDHAGTNGLFIEAVRENIAFHRKHCADYAHILKESGFDEACLRSITDITRIPVIPTTFLKQHALYSMPEDKFVIRAHSSGTQGMQSRVGIDRTSLALGVRMVWRIFSQNRLISPMPTHYIMLGYEPGGSEDMGAIQTAHGASRFAPALSRTYALQRKKDGYEVNLEGILGSLHRHASGIFPVRLLGFPAYLSKLLQLLEDENIKLRLPRNSRIVLGGGWKQFSGEEISHKTLFKMVKTHLGIEKTHIHEFFSAVEHPIAYCACNEGHFHVPIYSRAIVRDVHTLEPVPFGTPGLLSFITPMMRSMPLVSMMTDDIAVLHKNCTCGNASPYFVLFGRARADGLITCAQQSVREAGKAI